MMNADERHPGTTRGSWRIMLWGGVATVLALPALAMSLGSDGVHWTPGDFVAMGGLLALFGLAIEAAMRWVPSRPGRLIAAALALLAFLAIWAELAVGVFGTPFAGS